MPKRAQITVDINLIPKDPFFETVLGKILRWALSAGRYIVIFTELVVILSFLARFTLDRQLTNLNGTINQKTNVINSYGDLEYTVRMAQLRIQQYQQLEQQTNISDVFPALSQITPRDVQLEELVIRPSSIVMSGRVLSQTALNLLINNIQLSPQFNNISVDKIQVGDSKEPGFAFRLSADTKTESLATTNPTRR